MTLPTKLKAARLTEDSLGTDIPTALGALEQALCDILGLTIDVNVTSSLGIDNSGRLTVTLLLQKAAAPVGIRMLDTTGGAEFRLVNDGTYASIDKNTGTEALPVWVNLWKMSIFSGVVTFSAFPVTPSSAPTSNYQVANKKYVDDGLNLKESSANKGAVSGYASLDSATKVPTAQLGGSGADNTKFLRGDQAWAVFEKTVASSLATNGYWQHSSGIIIQWGTISCTANTDTAVTLPLTMPNALLNVQATFKDTFHLEYGLFVSSFSTSGFNIHNPDVSSDKIVCWFAVGY